MTILINKGKLISLNKLSSILAALLSAVMYLPAANLYWDTDSIEPLAGSSSTLNISGSYFSTSTNGDTALTTMGTGNDIYFQTDTTQAYEINVDAWQTNNSFIVSNGNDVTLVSGAGKIRSTNSIVITGGSRLNWSLSSGSKSVFNTFNGTGGKPDLILGEGDNTLETGGWGSDQFWVGEISGDAGDRIVATNGQSLYLVYNTASVFGGEFVGKVTMLPKAKLTLTGDHPDAIFQWLGLNTLQLGDGGTSGSIPSTCTIPGGGLTFNRSDDVVFSNVISTVITPNNIGSGYVTITSDMTGGILRGMKGSGTLSGNIHLTQYLRFEGTPPSTWILTGSNTVEGVDLVNFPVPIWLRYGGDLQIGDGTTSASLSLTNEAAQCRIDSTSSLAMDLRGGALLEVAGQLIAGNGSANYLKIIGDGQETPIITFGSMSSTFDGVVYNGVTNTWAGAQVANALGGVTQMRVESNAIYIDPLPPAGTVFIIH